MSRNKGPEEHRSERKRVYKGTLSVLPGIARQMNRIPLTATHADFCRRRVLSPHHARSRCSINSGSWIRLRIPARRPLYFGLVHRHQSRCPNGDFRTCGNRSGHIGSAFVFADCFGLLPGFSRVPNCIGGNENSLHRDNEAPRGLGRHHPAGNQPESLYGQYNAFHRVCLLAGKPCNRNHTQAFADQWDLDSDPFPLARRRRLAQSPGSSGAHPVSHQLGHGPVHARRRCAGGAGTKVNCPMRSSCSRSR